MACNGKNKTAAKYAGFSDSATEVVSFACADDYYNALNGSPHIDGYGDMSEDASLAFRAFAQDARLTDADRQKLWGLIKKAKPKKITWEGSNIPSELFELTSLRKLSIKGRMSVVPEGIANLTNLTDLDLSQNRLTKESLAALEGMNWAKLNRVDLRNNDFDGEDRPAFLKTAAVTGGRIWSKAIVHIEQSSVANVGITNRPSDGPLYFEKASNKIPKKGYLTEPQRDLWRVIKDLDKSEFTQAELEKIAGKKANFATINGLRDRGMVLGGGMYYPRRGSPRFDSKAIYGVMLSEEPTAEDYVPPEKWATMAGVSGTMGDFFTAFCESMGVGKFEELTEFQQLAARQAFYCVQPNDHDQCLFVVVNPATKQRERVLLYMGDTYCSSRDSAARTASYETTGARFGTLHKKRPDLVNPESKTVTIDRLNNFGTVVREKIGWDGSLYR
jgi:uncharacterized protein YjbI with pentapeptide repeats